ncbi:MAG: hypothetical protein IKE35_05940 [Lachnospiraceae bacterium]|nr:hypothetical protein [Lachnospiraceae bacterium]
MSLSFREFIEFIIHEKGYDSNEDKINRFIYGSTIGKMRMIALGVAVFEIIALIVSLTPKHQGAKYLAEYRWVYASILAVMLFALALFGYVKHDIDRRYRSLMWIMPVTSLLVQVWATVAMCVNAYALGFANPSLYIATALLIPICTYMHPLAYVAVAFTSDISMLVVYSRLKQAVPSPAPMTVVIATILLIKTVFTLMIYFLRKDYERTHSRTHDQNNILVMWIFVGFACCIGGFVMGCTGVFQKAFFAFLCLLCGMGCFMTGIILHFRPKTVCGIVASLLSAVPLFFQDDLWPWQLLVTAVIVTIALIIPGHLFRHYVKSQRY